MNNIISVVKTPVMPEVKVGLGLSMEEAKGIYALSEAAAELVASCTIDEALAEIDRLEAFVKNEAKSGIEVHQAKIVVESMRDCLFMPSVLKVIDCVLDSSKLELTSVVIDVLDGMSKTYAMDFGNYLFSVDSTSILDIVSDIKDTDEVARECLIIENALVAAAELAWQYATLK